MLDDFTQPDCFLAEQNNGTYLNLAAIASHFDQALHCFDWRA